jgi:Protein of unknown function (DUF3275)
MISIPGQLAIKTIHGRNGPFNVGRLTAAAGLGEFVIKDAELEQYRQGSYKGDFIITTIRPVSYFSHGRLVIEIRAHVSGMTLESIDALSSEEAIRLTPQEVDPIDEPIQTPPLPSPVAPPTEAPTPLSADPLVDTTPFTPKKPAVKSTPSLADSSEDVALFGMLWPLGPTVKLDSTVDRRLLRQQSQRLDKLGYEFDPPTQHWLLKAA